MDHFVWKDSFNIGVDEIDDQHKLFLDYVNECYNAASRDNQRRVTDATIYDLKVYAVTHFRFEEGLMKEKSYPALEGHIKQHMYFESQVVELEKPNAGGNNRTVESLLIFLRDWFLRHILEHDKKLAAFLA
jgi:hemerythrin-like metal-binding protein